MRVPLDDRKAPPPHATTARDEATDLTCLFNVKFAGQQPCDFSCSTAIERLTGYAPEQFYDLNIFDLPNGLWFQMVHADDREAYGKAWAQLQQGQEAQLEYRIRRADGQIRWVKSQVLRLDQADGFSFAGVLTDVTARRQTAATTPSIFNYQAACYRLADLAQALCKARDLPTVYRGLRDFAFAETPCFNISVSLVENHAHTLVYACSDGQELDLPHAPSQGLDQTSLHARAIAASEAVIADDAHDARAESNVIPVGFNVASPMPNASLIAPLTVQGRALGTVELQALAPAAFNHEHAAVMRLAASLTAAAIENVQWVEHERAHQEQLRQLQKMEAVGRLAGGVAHDFNNMLTAIIGYSQLIQARLEAASPLRYEVGEIQKAGQRAASLTGQLLAFSRKQVLQPKVLNLNAVVAEMRTGLQRLLGPGIDLISCSGPRLGQVKADPMQIEQLIANLASNARDAMPDGGKLTIETANVYLDEVYTRRCSPGLKPGAYIMLAVSDTGSGMDEATCSHIFEPFFTTKARGKGIGMGLSIVYGIVTQSGGDIRVDSEIGHGTSFKIYLPCVDQQAAVASAACASQQAVPVSETILLVEDEEVVRGMVREILKQNGYDVLEAANGQAALQVCKRHAGPIHLLLTDVVMPQMGGSELAEQVSGMRPETHVLFMSGYTDDALVRDGIQDAGLAFIQKPFTPDALTRKVRELIGAPTKSPTGHVPAAGVDTPARLTGGPKNPCDRVH